jgi:hypothetical protein
MIDWKKVEDELPTKSGEVKIKGIEKTRNSKWGDSENEIEQKFWFDSKKKTFSNQYLRGESYWSEKNNFFSLFGIFGSSLKLTHWAYINEPKEKE